MVEDEVYVMLMMMRSDDSYSPETVEGCTATELLACITADDYDACIAACSDEPEEPEDPEVVKNGTLRITVDDYSSSVISAPAVGIIKFNTIKLTADETITVNTLTLSKVGLSYTDDVKKVWFEKDGVRISSKASIAADGTATVNFTKGLTVKSNEKIDLVAELNMYAGNEIAFKIDSVSSTAEKTNINATTTTYRATSYVTAQVSYNETSVASAYKLGEQDEILFAKATVENTASDTSIDVKSLTFNSYNSDAETILKDVRLVRDGKDVSNSVIFDGKKVTIALNDTIESNKRAVYSLYAKTNSLDDDKETFNFVLDGAEGFVAYETTTNFRAGYDTATSSILASDGNEVVINGGKVVFTNDSTFATTVTAGKGYSDVQIANGTLTVAEPIMFNKLQLDESVVNSSIKSMVLEIAGTRYNADIDEYDSDADDVDDSTSYTFEDIYVNKTSNVKLYITLTNTATLPITLNNINGATIIEDGEYQNNGSVLKAADIAGTIKVAKVTVKDSTFTLTNENSSTVTVVEGDSDPVTIFDGKASSSKQDISLSKVIIKNIAGTTALSATNYVDLTLYVGNKTITKKCSADDCEIEYPISNVNVNSGGTSIKVVVEPTLTADDYQFTVEAEGLDSNNNTAKASAVNAAKLTVAGAASLSISASSQGNKVILEGGNRELLTFNVYAQHGSMELTDVSFDIDVLTNASDITVMLDGETLDGTKTLTAGTFLLDDLTETLSKGTHTFVVKANVVNVAAPHTITIDNLSLNAGAATSTVNPTYYIVKALPEISVVETGVDNEITLKVALPSSATTPIEVTDFTVSANGAIYIEDQEETSPLANPVTLNPGTSMNVVLKATAAGTAKITGIEYSTVDATPETYSITNTYTNFPRGKFQVTFKS